MEISYKKDKIIKKLQWMRTFSISLLVIICCLLPTNVFAKTYIIATDTTYAPFEFVDENGEYVGIDIDLLAAIAEDQGFEYEIRALGFNAALQALEANQVDGVIAGMSKTAEREEAFDMSDAYYESGVQFAVLANSTIESLEDLRGEQVAVKTGTRGAAVAESLQSEYGYTIVTFEDSVNMYEDVMVGNSAAVVEDYPVMTYAIQTSGLNLRLIADQIEINETAFAVGKGLNEELLTMFNQGLANLKASGEYDEIIDKYTSLTNTQQTRTIWSEFKTNAPALMQGLWTTLWVTFVSIVIAMLVGTLIGLMRVSHNKILSLIAGIYVDIMRGIPLIVLSFFIYFGIPQLTGIKFTAALAGIMTLSLNAAAYIGEIVRGGIQAIDRGQMEAARSLGLPYGKSMQKVILPQAFKLMVPSFINQFVITLKDTSILSVIGLVELTQQGKLIISRTFESGRMWLIVGIIYIVVITVLTKLSNRLEKELK